MALLNLILTPTFTASFNNAIFYFLAKKGEEGDHVTFSYDNAASS